MSGLITEEIVVFTTGGSIDKTYSPMSSNFVVDNPVAGDILNRGNVTVPFVVKPLLRKDSLEITAEERLAIVEMVNQDPHQKIIITHGTDTMIDTAKAIGRQKNKVIVLTGAMQPAAFKYTDADFNVGCAFVAVQLLPPGVYVVMNGRVFDPWKTEKDISRNIFRVL